MSRNADNRKRAFADVVTIDAWHEGFSDNRPRVDLHADVVFGTARRHMFFQTGQVGRDSLRLVVEEASQLPGP
jgi:hypothetical protein